MKDSCRFTDVSVRAPAGDTILDRVSWSLPEAGVGVVIGPSGSGKSRLVRLLNRLDEPTAGEVDVLGRPVSAWDVRELRLAAGWVPQSPALNTGAVRDSFAVLVEIGSLSVPDLDERLPGAMAVTGVGEDLLGREVASLSGGERHRVAIARALLLEPSLVVLDEPTGSLDGAAGRALLLRLREWAGERRAALVVVTHRLADVRTLGGRLLMLAGGRVAHAGDAAELLASQAGDHIRRLMAGEEPETPDGENAG